jgi:hypothetical protein
LGIGDWAQSPIPNPQSPIPNPQSPLLYLFKKNKKDLNLKNSCPIKKLLNNILNKINDDYLN